MTCDDIVHVVILTQVELEQIDLNLTVLNKHAMFDHLEKKDDILELSQHLMLHVKKKN